MVKGLKDEDECVGVRAWKYGLVVMAAGFIVYVVLMMVLVVKLGVG